MVGKAYGRETKKLLPLSLKKRNSDMKPVFEGLVQKHELEMQPLSAGIRSNADSD